MRKVKAVAVKVMVNGKQVTKWNVPGVGLFDVKPVNLPDVSEEHVEGACPYCCAVVDDSEVICPVCRLDLTCCKLLSLDDNRLRSPYPWFGTKRKVADDCWRLLNSAGQCQRFIEPFLGSAAMLLGKPSTQHVDCVVNDLNRYVANFWRAVQYAPDEVAEFCDWPVNECDLYSRHLWLEGQPFEETITGTPSGEEILTRLKALKKGLESNPLWFDARIAGWWCWGQSCWIGSGWCDGGGNHASPGMETPEVRPNVSNFGGVNRKLPQSERQRGVNAKNAKGKNPTQWDQCTMRLNGVAGVVKRPSAGRKVGTNRRGNRPQATRSKTGVHANGVIPEARPMTNDVAGVCSQGRREGLKMLFKQLQAALREVVVCCGSWERVCTSAVLGDRGVCGVFLDPPYKQFGECYGRNHDETVSARVRGWCRQYQKRERLRILLCGYEGGTLVARVERLQVGSRAGDEQRSQQGAGTHLVFSVHQAA